MCLHKKNKCNKTFSVSHYCFCFIYLFSDQIRSYAPRLTRPFQSGPRAKQIPTTLLMCMQSLALCNFFILKKICHHDLCRLAEEVYIHSIARPAKDRCYSAGIKGIKQPRSSLSLVFKKISYIREYGNVGLVGE